MNICIITALDNYESRAELLMKVFLEAGHSVIIMTSDWKHMDKIKNVETRKGYRLFHSRPYYSDFSASRISSHIDLSAKIFRYIDRHHKEIDLLWVIFPPNSLVKEAAGIKEKYPEIKLVLDANDCWPESLPAEKIRSILPLNNIKYRRRNYLHTADQVIVSCHKYEELISSELNNTPSKTIISSRDTVRPVLPKALPEDRISLCFLGTIDNMIDLSKTKEVIQNISEYKPVTLHIIGSGENLDLLVDAAKAGGAAVLYHGVIYDSAEKKKILDQCHYGLNIIKDSAVPVISKKSLDYFAAGLPILNTLKADTWEFTEKEKIGFNIQPSLDYEQVVNYDMSLRSNTADFYMNTFSYSVFKDEVLSLLVLQNREIS